MLQYHYMKQELLPKNEIDNIERRRVRDAVYNLYAKTGKYPSPYEVKSITGMSFKDVSKRMDELDIRDVRAYYQRKAGAVLEMLHNKAIKEGHTPSARAFLDFVGKENHSNVNIIQMSETLTDFLNKNEKKTIDATIIDKNDTDTDK